MKIVDPHHHLWDLDNLDYPWLSEPANDDWFIGNYKAIRRNYFPEDYRADTGRYEIVKSVHIDAGHDPSNPLDETVWLSGEAQRTGLPNAFVVSADLSAMDVDTDLARQAAYSQVRGIRQILNRHPDPFYNFVDADFLADPDWCANYSLLAKHDLSFDLQCYPYQFSDFADVAAKNPDVSVILNHTGMPLINQDGGLQSWKRELRKLAQLDHVSVKISGLGMMDRNWSTDSIRGIVLETIDIFEPKRCMFASNFPVDRLFGSFESHFDAFVEITADFSAADQHDLFRGTAERVYRI